MRKMVGQIMETVDKYVVICDGCGEDLSTNNSNGNELAGDLKFNFGWESRRDGMVFSFDLCEHCADDVCDDLMKKYENIKKIVDDYFK